MARTRGVLRNFGARESAIDAPFGDAQPSGDLDLADPLARQFGDFIQAPATLQVGIYATR